jgi:O-antigen/teichoic acid export membrane protein
MVADQHEDRERGEALPLLDTDAAGPAAIRGGSLRVGGYLAGAALSVVSAAVLFRALGVEDSGRYVTVFAIVSLATAVTDAGLATIGLRELSAHAGDRRERFMRSLLGARLALGLVGVLLALAFTQLAGYGSMMVAAAALAGLAVLLQIVQQTLTIPLVADLRFVPVVSIDLLRQAAATVLTLAVAVAGAGLVVFVGVTVPAMAIALVVTLVMVAGLAPIRPSAEIAEWRELLRDTLPYALATAVAAIYFRCAVVIVSLVASEQQTGYFGASFRVVEVLMFVPQLAIGAAFPIFARSAGTDRKRLEYGVGRALEASFLGGIGMATMLAIGAPTIIQVIAGDAFQPSESVLAIQGMALAAAFIGAPLAYALLSLHLHRAVLWASLTGLIANVVLVTVLTRSFGAQGAAVATFLAELAMTVGFAVGIQRSGLRPTVSLSLIPRIVVAALIAASPLLIPNLPNPVALALAILLFVGAALALRAVPPELLDEGRRVMLRGRTA